MEAAVKERTGIANRNSRGEVVAGTVRTKKRGRAKKAASDEAQGKKNKALGKRGEEAAAQYLARRGYTILERNWKCFAGEADIIARDGDVLVFAEVKTRHGLSMGFPSEAVTKDKRERYEKIACAYVADHDFNELMLRFDVMGLVVLDEDRVVVRHHINAFPAESMA